MRQRSTAPLLRSFWSIWKASAGRRIKSSPPGRLLNNYNQSVTVKFEDGRYVDYEFTQLDELELAYAITVHKAQGSEYPAVIIPMYQGPRMLMNRNILYTAVTRARKCVCMIGDERIFNQMAENVSETRRYSSLDERIKEIKNIE